MVLKDFLAYRKNLLHVYDHKSSGHYWWRHFFDLMTSLEMTFGRTEDKKTEGDMLGVCCMEKKIYMVN